MQKTFLVSPFINYGYSMPNEQDLSVFEIDTARVGLDSVNLTRSSRQIIIFSGNAVYKKQ
jgi:hypothetical protein